MFVLTWTVPIRRAARLLAVGLASALLAGCGGGAFPDQSIKEPPHTAGAEPRLPADELFAELDVDHDGLLEPSELHGHWRAIFVILDPDGHGAVTPSAFLALPSPKMAGRTTLMQIEAPDRFGAFTRLDTDGDGLLSLPEFLAAGDQLADILDRGHKGGVSREDLGIPLREKPADLGILRLPPPPAPMLAPSPVPPPAKPATAANPPAAAPTDKASPATPPAAAAAPADQTPPADQAKPSKKAPPPSTAAPPPKPRTLAPSELPPMPPMPAPPAPNAPKGGSPSP